MGFFSQPDPKEQVREWKRQVRGESRKLQREIRSLEREITKTTRSIKANLKRGDKSSARILAKQVVISNKRIDKLYQAKVNCNSVMLHMDENLALLKMGSAMKSSAQIMQSMSSLLKIGAIANVMRNMTQEMMKTEILDEMTTDMLEDEDEDSDMEEAADEEVQKILDQISASKSVTTSPAVSTVIEPDAVTATATTTTPIDEEPTEEYSELSARFAALAD